METTAEAQSPDIKFVYAYKKVSEEGEKHRIMMVDSLKTNYPGVDVIETPMDYPNELLMVYRCRHYAEMRRQLRGNLIFLDTDVISMRPMKFDFFKDDWDIGLTHGRTTDPYVLMPYCGSFIASRDTEMAQLWFDEVWRAAINIPEGMVTNNWWVDQLAMAWAVDHIAGLKCALFDNQKFNFVPEGVQATKAFFVHCKGPRKHLMRQYYNCVKKTDYTGF